MDNFSQEEEKDINEQNSVAKNVEDIEFEESFEDTEAQKKSDESVVEEQEQILENVISDEDLAKQLQEELSDLKPSESEEEKAQKEAILSNQNAKKYVIYINSDNIDFMESLSLDERREMINTILKEQNAFIKRRKKQDSRTKFIKHLLIMVFTFIVSFPVIFFVVNKATELTIINYKRSSENFSKLYREQGKIKPNNSNTIEQIKY